MKSSRLTISSRTGNLEALRDFVADGASRFGFNPELAGKIALAVDEACTNIIKHAYGFATDRSIEIQLNERGDEFEIVIQHDGESFNPENVSTPDMKEYLSQYRRGGLGIHLMRSLMDRVEYSTTDDQRSQVRLVKTLPRKVGS